MWLGRGRNLSCFQHNGRYDRVRTIGSLVVVWSDAEIVTLLVEVGVIALLALLMILRRP